MLDMNSFIQVMCTSYKSTLG